MSEFPTFIPVSEAQALVLQAVKTSRSESVPLSGAIGRVLASDLQSRWPLPQASLSVMDGYALASSDFAEQSDLSAIAVIGKSAAGHPASTALPVGYAMPISTGAMLPDRADVVVAVEDTVQNGSFLAIRGNPSVTLQSGRFVRARGSEVAKDAVILQQGLKLGAGEVALAAACGHISLDVRTRPKVAIVSTGDELVELGENPKVGQIVETNALMLAAQVEEAGGHVGASAHALDKVDGLRATIARALHDCDIVLTCGGISVGEHDLVYAALLHLGLQPLFSKVRLQPGKPLNVGKLGDTTVFCLPGNPGSAYVTFELFVRPLIQAILGRPAMTWRRRHQRVTLATAVQGDVRRDHYVRCQLHDGRAYPLPQQASGALPSLVAHDALACIPAGSAGAVGMLVDAWVIREAP